TTLNSLAATLRQRFPNSAVRVETPAVIIPFGSTRSERHEIIPADYISSLSGFNVYAIPNRAGGWMQSSPEFYGAYVNAVHERLGDKAKPLIRLLKAWKYYCDVPIRSFYLEMRCAEFANTQKVLMYKFDVCLVLNHLISVKLAAMADPLNLPNP